MNRAAPLLALLLLAGCHGRAAPEIKDRPNISQRTRVENLPIRIEKSQSISDTEAVKIIIVPGFLHGKRCIVYTNPHSSAMVCDDISASRQ